jgi:hypothetical protein
MGYQEPAPRSAPHRQGLAPAWWVTAAVIVVVGWIWLDRRAKPEPQPVEPALPVAVATAPETYVIDSDQAEQIAHLQQKLREAQREIGDRGEEIETLDRQLQAARADAELHKRGLERAVAELNRINEDLEKLEAAAQSLPRPSLPSPPTEKVRPLGAPFVTTTLSGYVVASGLVHNPTKYPARGTLEVSLVGSGGVIDTRGFVMHVGPGETERYDVTFTNIFPTERLGAQAQWVQSP